MTDFQTTLTPDPSHTPFRPAKCSPSFGTTLPFRPHAHSRHRPHTDPSQTTLSHQEAIPTKLSPLTDHSQTRRRSNSSSQTPLRSLSDNTPIHMGNPMGNQMNPTCGAYGEYKKPMSNIPGNHGKTKETMGTQARTSGKSLC